MEGFGQAATAESDLSSLKKLLESGAQPNEIASALNMTHQRSTCAKTSLYELQRGAGNLMKVSGH
jgi:hypothetical protein